MHICIIYNIYNDIYINIYIFTIKQLYCIYMYIFIYLFMCLFMYLDIHTYIYIHNRHRLIIALNNFVFKYAWLFHSTYIIDIYIYTYTLV